MQCSFFNTFATPILRLRSAYATPMLQKWEKCALLRSVRRRLAIVFIFIRGPGRSGGMHGPRDESLLEVCIIFVEPGGFYLEGAGEGLVGVHRTRELGHAVTLERDVVDRLA